MVANHFVSFDGMLWPPRSIIIWLLCAVDVASAQTMLTLEDVTEKSGLKGLYNYRMAICDFNRDNRPDVLSVYGPEGSTQLRLFYNQLSPEGNVFFTEDSLFYKITKQHVCELAVVCDGNNDGFPSILTLGTFYDKIKKGDSCVPNSKNKWNYRMYELLSDTTGVFFSPSFNASPVSASSINIADYNLDGMLDYYVGSWYDSWCMNKPANKLFFVSINQVMRVENAEKSGLLKNNKGNFGSTTTDWNNDGWMDIFTCPYDTAGLGNAFRNNGDGTFTDVAEQINYSPCTMKGDNNQPMVPWEAMPCDFDNDGDMDFALALVHGGADEGEGRTCLLENLGKKENYKLKVRTDLIKRVNPQDSHHGDHKVIWADLNNDGWQDLIISDGGYLKGPGKGRVHFCLQNPKTHQLIDVTVKMGLVDTTNGEPAACIHQPHAVESVDFDLDGDEDILVGKMGLSDFGVLENKTGNSNNWIKIKLEAPPGVNRDCAGAMVKITAGGITQTREVNLSQGHYGGQQWNVLNVGIGKSKKIDSIVVIWPDRTRSKTLVKKIKPNQFISIGKEGIVK